MEEVRRNELREKAPEEVGFALSLRVGRIWLGSGEEVSIPGFPLALIKVIGTSVVTFNQVRLS